MTLTETHPCRYCTNETGRTWNCKQTCDRYLAYLVLYPEKEKEKEKTKYELEKEFEENTREFMGYIIQKSGDIKHKYKNRYIKPIIRNGKKYVTLSENGISETFPLDQVVYRAFNCCYRINSKKILHRNGNELDCSIGNLYLED